ncbi:uncharacterized protein FTJAE_4146 [Fusarium tjaetaba]|uniref:Uncharacterized protein n=1 Tax=Fusarium tjaetaba TaxID=1567544 RepID=A0A8H5W1J6_9HYPO|nr:uncharacterized protein FTJAE_4146 [Fusarium tjaetaba]KAF5641494.1 hypothetical protein FTJAE_4146 [Fusarium tjaetaba]
MINHLWRPPRKEPGVKSRPLDKEDPENFQYYRKWGFTVYRTYYGSDSNQHWDALIDAMTRQTLLALGYHEDDDMFKNDKRQKRGLYSNKAKYLEDVNRLKKLFRLSTREDVSLLDGLDIHQIREVCVKELPEAKKNIEGANHCFALVADEAVLKDVARGVFVIKAVGYDWDEDRAGQGWVRMLTGDILSLWESLLLCDYICHDIYAEMHREVSGGDLDKDTWPGLSCIEPLGDCSEARTADPTGTARITQFRIDY